MNYETGVFEAAQAVLDEIDSWDLMQMPTDELRMMAITAMMNEWYSDWGYPEDTDSAWYHAEEIFEALVEEAIASYY